MEGQQAQFNLPGRPIPRPPANLDCFVQVLGYQLAIEFFLTFGGAEMYIGANPKGRSAVEALIGRDKLERLIERLPNPRFRVPLAKKWTAQVMCWQGHSSANIARTLRVTDTTVRGYLKPDQYLKQK